MDVRTLCLGVLCRGDASGYEIKKMFEDGPIAAFQSASFGSIYPALSRLLADGLVEAREQEQAGRPDKKVYSITSAGRAVLIDALCMPPPPDNFRSDFLFILFHALELPEEQVRLMIDERIVLYRERHGMIEERKAERKAVGVQDACHDFVGGFGKALYAAAADYLEANRDGFIAALRSTKTQRQAAE